MTDDRALTWEEWQLAVAADYRAHSLDAADAETVDRWLAEARAAVDRDDMVEAERLIVALRAKLGMEPRQ